MKKKKHRNKHKSNIVAKDLRTPKYRVRIVEDKKRKSKNTQLENL